jgi:hypothetical protein
VPDLGDSVAHLFERPSLTVEQLDANDLGDLVTTRVDRDGHAATVEEHPDVIHVRSRDRTLVRMPRSVVPRPPSQGSKSGASAGNPILVIRRATAGELKARTATHQANHGCDR